MTEQHITPSVPVICVHRGLALYMALYGIVLLLPLNTFAATPTFREIERYIAEPVLGVVFCVLAIGALLPQRVLCRIMLAIAAAFLVGMGVLAVIGNPSTPAWINYIGAAIIAGALAWRRA